MKEATLIRANSIKREILELKEEIRALHKPESIKVNGSCLLTVEPVLFSQVKELCLEYYCKRLTKIEKSFLTL